MCVCALPTCVSIHHVYAEACCMRGQKRASDPKELEVTLAGHMDPGDGTQVLWKNRQPLLTTEYLSGPSPLLLKYK